MLDESLRCRLEALNRGPIPAPSVPIRGDGKAASAARQIAAPILELPSPRTAYSPAHYTPGLIHSGNVVETSAGQHVRIRLPLESLWQNGSQLIAARQEFLRSQAQAAQDAIEPTVVMDAEFASFVAALPDRTVALDLETCGLAGSALFLIGLFRQIDGQPTIELLLARNYSEEAAVLTSLWQTIADCRVLVTFNGKTFDWPMVIERSVRHRLRNNGADDRFVHFDILHHARRRWRKHLPNCRLQTLEWHVCRRRRTADIPGHCIPAVYADYVRTGFERDMDTVLHHNALDLVTLFDLALRLAA
jgi:uncharacterized protein YprB with RNaseH-like and TPR domain